MTISGSGNVGIGISTPSASLHVVGDAIVTGKITAEEFHTEFVSSSIIYQSGSTKFGDDNNDVHSITGSIQQGGTGVNSYFLGGLSVGTSANHSKLTVAGAVSSSNIDLSQGIVYLKDSIIREVGSNNYNGGALGTTFAISSLPTSSYDAVFFDYVIRKNSASDRYGRTGTIMAFYSASEVSFTDTSTVWMGAPSGENSVDLYVEIDNSNIVLKADVTYDSWKIKAIARGI